MSDISITTLRNIAIMPSLSFTANEYFHSIVGVHYKNIVASWPRLNGRCLNLVGYSHGGDYFLEIIHRTVVRKENNLLDSIVITSIYDQPTHLQHTTVLRHIFIVIR